MATAELVPTEYAVVAYIRNWPPQNSGPFLSRGRAEETAAALAKGEGVMCVEIVNHAAHVAQIMRAAGDDHDIDKDNRIAELEAAIREMHAAIPGGTHCDPQLIADAQRAIAERVGVSIPD